MLKLAHRQLCSGNPPLWATFGAGQDYGLLRHRRLWQPLCMHSRMMASTASARTLMTFCTPIEALSHLLAADSGDALPVGEEDEGQVASLRMGMRISFDNLNCFTNTKDDGGLNSTAFSEISIE